MSITLLFVILLLVRYQKKIRYYYQDWTRDDATRQKLARTRKM